jgi:hypothetical protein
MRDWICAEPNGVINNERSKPPNENKISDGWRGGAWLRVEGGISWKVRNRACQPFAASHG